MSRNDDESAVAVLDADTGTDAVEETKPKARKRTTATKTATKAKTTKKTTAKAKKEAEEASDAPAEVEEKKPKTTRRKTTKKAAEAEESVAEASPEVSVETSSDDSAPPEASASSSDASSEESAAREVEASSDDSESSTTASKSERSDNNNRRNNSNNRNKKRRRSRGSRKSSVSFKDLQEKIEPELQLLAKEVGLDDYREMSKDELVVAILEKNAEAENLTLVSGNLEISSDGYGFLQKALLGDTTRSVIVSAGLIKQFKLRSGDTIMGKCRHPRENERYGTLIRVEAVNNVEPQQAAKRPRFDDLVPTFPDHRIMLETTQKDVSARVIDLLAPIGRGQRGLIVAPPKAGKTTLLKAVANAVVNNAPDIKVFVLLIDERPEEVTDFRESVDGVEVIASTFDEPPTNHIRVAEFVHERAKRIVEEGGDVMILLDSITRLARANNLVTPPTGRTLSGGLDSSALHWPKRFLGAARNIRGGGSLSILATALIETGSRMDDVIFEEFKGTGNMELHLSRRLEERRIFPAIDITKSSTRREDLLLGEDTMKKMWLLRKVISEMDPAEAMEMLLARLGRTKSNEEFLATLGNHG